MTTLPPTNYSFKLPDFGVGETIDGQGYKQALKRLTSILNTHLVQAEILMESQELLPDSVAESLRVAVGGARLLLKKRLGMFEKEMHHHLNPTPGDTRATRIDDLHGLWSLVEINLEDIRKHFDKVEASRLHNWTMPDERKNA